MIRTPALEDAVFPLGVLATIIVFLAFPIGSPAQVLVLAPAVALLGLPHGALDLAVGRQIWALRTLRDHTVFIAGYLGLAAATLAIWLMFPGVALALFLAYSAYHFSGDWEGWGRIWRLAGSTAIIGAPALLHLTEVEAIFVKLSDPRSAAVLAFALSFLGGFAALTTVVAAVSDGAKRRIGEHALLWLAAVVLPPLLFFVAYFCFLHAPRHMRLSLGSLQDRGLALWSSAVLATITLLAATGAFFAMPAGFSVSDALLSVIFIGLASLTVPHMILVDLWHAAAPAGAEMQSPGSAATPARRRPKRRSGSKKPDVGAGVHT